MASILGRDERLGGSSGGLKSSPAAPSEAFAFLSGMNTYAYRRLGRVADAAGISTQEIRELIEIVVDDYLGNIPREPSIGPRVTGCREVFGEGHATVSYISDPEGTDIIAPGYEPPPGYHGPQRR